MGDSPLKRQICSSFRGHRGNDLVAIGKGVVADYRGQRCGLGRYERIRDCHDQSSWSDDRLGLGNLRGGFKLTIQAEYSQQLRKAFPGYFEKVRDFRTSIGV